MTFEERKQQVSAFLGKTVEIVIDRPVGFVHRKENFSLTYPVNYGFIPGVFGGDGKELDVYLLGVAEPANQYKCRIIAIIHRLNDNEDKLVAAAEEMHFSKEEIEKAVSFQEQFFNTEIQLL